MSLSRPSRCPFARLVARVLIAALLLALIPSQAYAARTSIDAPQLPTLSLAEAVPSVRALVVVLLVDDPSLPSKYHRARWMDPRTGRFASVDSYGGDRFEPSSLHRYSYAANDPGNRIDPSGEMTLVGLAIASVISAALSGIAVAVMHQVFPETRAQLSIWQGVGIGAVAGPLALACPACGVGIAVVGLVQALSFGHQVFSDPKSTGTQKAVATLFVIAAIYGGYAAGKYWASRGHAPLPPNGSTAPATLTPGTTVTVPAASLRGVHGFDRFFLLKYRALAKAGVDLNKSSNGRMAVLEDGSIFNGHHRIRAAAELGQSVEVDVYPGSMGPSRPILEFPE